MDAQPLSPQPGLILRPNLVKGVVGHERKPDRFFYLLYEGAVWECDGYRVGPPGAPDDAPAVNWTIHLLCPACHNNLLLDSLKKKIHVTANGAGLESEPMRCTWPAQFGGQCPFSVTFDLPRPSEREVIIDGGRRVLIDAIARRA